MQVVEILRTVFKVVEEREVTGRKILRSEWIKHRRTCGGFESISRQGADCRKKHPELFWGLRMRKSSEPEGKRQPVSMQKRLKTAMEKAFGKKAVGEVLKDLIYKPQGKPTLAPASDKRAEFKPEELVLDAFDDVEE